MHAGPDGRPMSDAAQACLAATIVSLAVNVPRRLSFFLVGSCETAYREKEVLADDAQISMFASQKVNAPPPPMETPQSPSKSPPSRTKPPPSSANGGRTPPQAKGGRAGGRPPASSSSKGKAPGKKVMM
jgi:hypothetical protein